MIKVYLACAYSHSDARVRDNRYKDICYIAGMLIKEGYMVYCPIAHSHGISEINFGCSADYEYWRETDEEMIRWADEVWVYVGHDGVEWLQSKGVSEEVKYARNIGRVVRGVRYTPGDEFYRKLFCNTTSTGYNFTVFEEND